MTDVSAVMALNSGSSSIKAGIYQSPDVSSRLLSVEVERIGLVDGLIRIVDASGEPSTVSTSFPDFEAALHRLFAIVEEHRLLAQLSAVGHRVVHGGPEHRRHELVTPSVLTSMQQSAALARNHMPQALAGIDFVARALPGVDQVACFDTAFHQTLPAAAKATGLARDIADEHGIERYGFHGLSYEYLCNEVSRLDPVERGGRMIVAHLGNGASMAAIRDGTSVDTTMGFTPNSGLLMGTRSGDIEPGVVTFLMRERGMSVDAIDSLLEQQSGLRGVSGTTADMRELLNNEATDSRAAEAIALFCHRARKTIGAYASVLSGLDTLVFSAGIGERSAVIRERICDGQRHLGIVLDRERNLANAPVISRQDSRVTVRVIHTDEEAMIVRHTIDLVSRSISIEEPSPSLQPTMPIAAH